MIDIANQRFGRLIALKPIKERNNNGCVIWKCLCDCGTIKNIQNNSLRNGRAKSCGCLHRENLTTRLTKRKGNKALNKLFELYNTRASRNDREFHLTFDQFAILTKENCHYCKNTPKNFMEKNGDEYTYNGIDRKDNTLGYNLDNCVPCCKFCNNSKHTTHYNEFIQRLTRSLV